MAECIHGFDEGLCDTCYPRPVPEATAKPATTRRVGDIARPSRRRAPGEAKQPERKTVPLAERRIYHATHLRNLESILIDGAIRAGVNPAVDVMAPAVRERRAAVEVVPGTHVSEFVPFSLSPDATWWQEVRSGAKEARWSGAVRAASPTQFAILVGTVGSIGPEVVLADADPSEALTHFTIGRDAASIALRRITERDPDLLEPEILARGEYPTEQLALIAVPSEPVKERVRQMLSEIDRPAPRVAVFPPWFRPEAHG
ncbi:DarT ssDNA thymidine ADP-ribosyltransferase family protein [Herbiconiux sp. SYSU D00978]|uniref:DarT ssDNA thymidine ADP-ribosyltransferase family protein n=1 Tax=Herbiconiux sp. SYSU D00978 TaxID=2812562 RepID=UPI001A967782|nr:DarT ssDNA thymidine ADP-ribosyltransferase family protein [Herbiconiux sp. SYSU D00978]